MNMKAMLGTILALLLAVGGTAYLAARGATVPPPPPPPIPPGIDGQLETNPFDLTAAGPKPTVVVEKTHFDFPVMALGSEESHDFEFKNTGDGQLRLAKGPLMCKCTVPTVPDEGIEPGKSVKITLTWKPLEMSTDFRKEAVIWTNDPKKPKINLTIKGQVIPDPGVFPSYFGLGDIPWDKDVEAEVQIVSAVSKELNIEGAEVSNPEWMSVTYTKDEADKLLPQGGGSFPKPQSGYTIKVKITPNETEGPFSGWVKLKINRNDGVQKIDVMGVRAGPISIFGDYYQAANSLVRIERVKSNEGKVTRIFLALTPFGEDLKILDINSKSKLLTATLKKESKPGDAKERYALLVEVLKGATPGTVFTFEQPDELIIKTNHPQVPELKLKARYVIQ